MATKPDEQTEAPACRHVGFADDPFTHADSPTDRHRCYLWMQRDMIDQDHQGKYCLSSRYQDCPWPKISLPFKSEGRGGQWKEALIGSVSEGGRRSAFAVLSLLRAGASRGAPLLWSLLLWIWVNGTRGLGLLASKISSAAGAVIRAVIAGRRGPRRTTERVPSRLRPSKAPEAAGTEDFQMLIRLGRDAHRAGRRKEAHSCFEKAVKLDPNSEEVWLWMAATAQDSQEAQKCLETALAINPASGRGQVQLAGFPVADAPGTQQDEGELLDASVNASRLIDEGLRAMDERNEDRAHHFFAAATEVDGASELAWYWRAKTATDLAEVIRCLETVLDLNPANQKAQASLKWALERRRMDAERQQSYQVAHQESRGAATVRKPGPPAPPWILHVASFGYLFLTLLWAAPTVLSFLDQELVSLYRKTEELPLLELPFRSSLSLGLPDGLVPEFNIFQLIPIVLVVLCFVAMETVWSTRLATALYMTFVIAVSIVATVLFVDNNRGLHVLLSLGVVTAIAGVAGWALYRRRIRLQAWLERSDKARAASAASGGRR